MTVMTKYLKGKMHMGQWYTVEANLKFKNGNPDRFCEIIRNEIHNRNEVSALFDLSHNLNTPIGCFMTLTSAYLYINQGHNDELGGDVLRIYRIENENDFPDGILNTDFMASYGWERVIAEIFCESADGLEDGSWINIYPEHGHTFIKVQDGRVSVEGNYDSVEDLKMFSEIMVRLARKEKSENEIKARKD